MDRIYVIGHRNPDCDSIAAALGYAELKQMQGHGEVVAARAGEPNPETRFALEYFGVEAPMLVEDLRPRVRDVMNTDVVTVSPDEVFYEAARLIQRQGVKMLPVSDEEGRLEGIVSVSDLAERYVNGDGVSRLASATTVGKLVAALGGRLLAGEPGREIRGRIITAAMQSDTMVRYISPGDVVLVGDRPDAQEAALAAGAACLVVTGGLPVAPGVMRLAEERGAAIVGVDLDTFSAARRVEMAVPVSALMRREAVTLSPNDLLAEARQVAAQTRHRTYPVVDETGRLVGVVSRADLAQERRRKVILVDHNASAEAVAGIEEAEVLEIIDHHRLADLQTAGPIFFRLEPVGSSSTIVTSMFLEAGLRPSRGRAGMLLSAILSDTLLFKSPTCTPKDRAMAEVLWETASVDWQQYGLALLRAGSNLDDKTARQLITMDYKVFHLEGRRLGVGQFNTMDLEHTLKRREELLEEMAVLRAEADLDAVLVMVTDPIQEASEVLYTVMDPRLVEAAFGRLEAVGSVRIPGMVSRKKQMIPLLTRALAAVAGAA